MIENKNASPDQVDSAFPTIQIFAPARQESVYLSAWNQRWKFGG